MGFLAWHVVICLWQNFLRKSILLYGFENKNLYFHKASLYALTRALKSLILLSVK